MTEENVKREYYSSGQLHEECPCNEKGQRHGLRQVWFENGQLQFETPYQNGVIHGVSRQWDENGQLRSETPFKYESLHGVARIWDKKGRLTTEFYWEDRRLYFTQDQANLFVEFLENMGYKIEPPTPPVIEKKKRKHNPS